MPTDKWGKSQFKLHLGDPESKKRLGGKGGGRRGHARREKVSRTPHLHPSGPGGEDLMTRDGGYRVREARKIKDIEIADGGLS